MKRKNNQKWKNPFGEPFYCCLDSSNLPCSPLTVHHKNESVVANTEMKYRLVVYKQHVKACSVYSPRPWHGRGGVWDVCTQIHQLWKQNRTIVLDLDCVPKMEMDSMGRSLTKKKVWGEIRERNRAISQRKEQGKTTLHQVTRAGS